MNETPLTKLLRESVEHERRKKMNEDNGMLEFDDLPTHGRSGRALEVDNAVIARVSIDNENHGCLDAWLHLEFGSGGCAFGGWKLGNADGNKLEGGNYAGVFLAKCIKCVFDYGKWENLEGKNVRVLHEGWGGRIIAIGHIIKNRWFCPQVEWEETKKKSVQVPDPVDPSSIVKLEGDEDGDN